MPSFPSFIEALPQAELPLPGVKGYILGAPQAQAVFFVIPAGTEIPLHTHGDQWGVVVEGEIDFQIGEQRRVYRRGDSYFIPAGTPHGGKVLREARIIEVFAEPDRWKPRE